MPPILAHTLLSMESFYSSVDPDLSRPRRLPPKLVAGIRAEVMPLRHSSLCSYFIPPFCLDDITLIITTIIYGFSGSIVALWLSAFSCIIVGTSDGLIAASETSWAIICHPPRFFNLSPWLVNNAGYLCGDHSTHQGHDEKRKHKMSLPFRGKHPRGALARRAPCCRNKLLHSGKILFIQDCFWTHLILYNQLIFSFWVFFIFNCIN